MTKNRFRMALFPFAMLTLISTLTGCVKENTDDCRSFRFHFEYTFNQQNRDLLASGIGNIRVYLFDRDDILSDIIDVDTRDLVDGYTEVDLDPGIYTAVAWGFSGREMLEGGFMDAEMTNPQTRYYQSPVLIGVTTLPDFRMMLRHSLLPSDVQGEIAPLKDPFDDLFFASLENIEVIRGAGQSAYFSFIKDSNTLKIKINGLNNLGTASERQPDIFVIGKNGEYSCDNTINRYAPQVRYQPAHRNISETTLEIDIKVLKLNLSHLTTDSIMLYITNPSTGSDIYPPIHVVKTIMQAKDLSGNHIIAGQEDLDRYDEFPIELDFDVNMGLSVRVFGYNVIGSEQELQ